MPALVALVPTPDARAFFVAARLDAALIPRAAVGTTELRADLLGLRTHV